MTSVKQITDEFFNNMITNDALLTRLNLRLCTPYQLRIVFSKHFQEKVHDVPRLSKLLSGITCSNNLDELWFEILQSFKSCITIPKNKGVISKVFITILRSKTLKKNIECDKNITDYKNIIDYLYMLATKVPYGINQLNRILKFQPSKILTNMYQSSSTLVQNILQFGADKDIYFLIRRPELLEKAGLSFILPAAAKNQRTQVIKIWIYLYETIWNILSVLPPEVSIEIWNKSMYHHIFSEDVIKNLGDCPNKNSLAKLNQKFSFFLKKKNTFHIFSADLPKHADPKVLFHHTMGKCYVTPKADGIAYFCKFLPDDVFPPKPMCRISAEQIKIAGKTVYIVYDVDTPGFWLERMSYLKKTYNEGIYNEGIYNEGIYNEETFFSGEEKVSSQIMNFEDLLKTEHKVVWWPKPIIPMNDHIKVLNLIDEPPVTPYPNDGWIVASEKHNTVKIKPFSHLTIDVIPSFKWKGQVDTSKIYRHYWIKDESQCEASQEKGERGEWVPREIRDDKKNVNPYDVVNLITNLHKFPWTPKQLIPFVGNRPYYSSSKGIKTPDIVKCLKKQKEIQKSFFDDDDGMGIHIGSGYRNSKTPILDIDPYILVDKCFNPRWIDGNTMKCPISGMDSECNGGFLVNFSFSMHYLWKSEQNVINFFKNYRHTLIKISVVDLDSLKFVNDVHTFIDGSTITKVSDLYPGAILSKSLLKWNDQNNEIIEPILSVNMIKKRFGLHNYKVVREIDGELNTKFIEFEQRI